MLKADANLKHLSATAHFKAGAKPGEFEAIVSVFNVVDSYKEIVAPGAITEYLTIKGNPVVCFMHDWTAPIGVIDECRDALPGDPVLPDSLKLNGGIYIKGRLLIDDIEKAREVHALLKAEAIKEWSIGYYLKEYTVDRETGIWTLTKIDLVEASPVLRGANHATATLGVKASGETLLDEASAVLDAAEALIGRVTDLLEKRKAEKGRAHVSQPVSSVLSEIAGLFAPWAKAELDDEVEPPDPKQQPTDTANHDAQQLELLANSAKAKALAARHR
jgi:HK97 family phage prohead protease